MTPAELYLKVVHPDDLAFVGAAVAKGLEGDDAVFMYRIVRPDGEVQDVRGMVQRIEATGEYPAILLSTAVDVTPPA